MRRSSPSRVTDRMRPRHTSSIDAAPGPANSAARRRRRRRGPARGRARSDRPGPRVEVVGDGRAALDQQLQVALGAELVEQLAERRRGARGTAAPWRRRAPAPSTIRSGSPRGAGASRTVRLGSSARTVPAPTRIDVALGAERVGVGPGLRAGDPLAGAVGRGGAAVERRRQLQHHVGPAGAAVVEVGRQQRLRLRRARTPDLDLDAGGPQPLDALAGDVRVGVLDRHDHPPDAGGDERVGARAGCGRGASTARGSPTPWRPARSWSPAAARAAASA